MTQENLAIFRQRVENFAELQSEIAFENEGRYHAAIVAGTIFQKANNYLYIYSSNLNNNVSGLSDFIDNLKKLIYTNDDIEIKVLLENYDVDDKSIALEFLLDLSETNKNIQLKKINESQNILKKIGHIIISDDKMIRIETDTSNYGASCSFNYNKTDEFKKLFLNQFNATLNTLL